jgi:hypothetical protein
MRRFNKLTNIFSERHMVAICSVCGNTETNSIEREEFIRNLRSNGWSIGKRVLCSNCRKLKLALPDNLKELK